MSTGLGNFMVRELRTFKFVFFLYFLVRFFSHSLMIAGTPNTDSGVMVIVVGNGHGDTSSNPGRD